MSFNDTHLPIYSCQFQKYLFYIQDFLKEAKSQITFSSTLRELACYEGFGYRGILTVRRKISKETTQARVSFIACKVFVVGSKVLSRYLSVIPQTSPKQRKEIGSFKFVNTKALDL